MQGGEHHGPLRSEDWWSVWIGSALLIGATSGLVAGSAELQADLGVSPSPRPE